MLLKEIIQRIQSLYSKGVQSRDSRLSSRHIYNKLLTVRTRLITEQSNKKQKISSSNYQTLSCVEMIKVPNHECLCIPPSGCEVYRSKYKIPKVLTDMNNHLLRNVYSIDGAIKYSEVSLLEKKYSKGNKYTKFKPDYYRKNDYLFTTTTEGTPKLLSLEGLFEDPIMARLFEQYCENDCDECSDCISPMDLDFPIDSDRIDIIVEFAVKELIQAFNTLGEEDVTSNGIDDGKQERK